MSGDEIFQIAVKSAVETGVAEAVKKGLAAALGKRQEVVEDVERKLVRAGNPGLQSLTATLTGGLRLELAARFLARYRRILDERNIPERELPPKLFLPMLEEAAGETDDYLQEKWAQLMASATREDADRRPTRLYIEKLKQLDPIEAKLLDELHVRRIWYAEGSADRLNVAQLCDLVAIDKNTLLTISKHLGDLGLLAHGSEVAISPLGIGFVASCRGEN